MLWHDHSNFKGKHALFSPSQPGFLKLTPEEFQVRLVTKEKSGIGTEIHDWCFNRIMRRHKITSIKDLSKSIDEFIFAKYFNKERGVISQEGKRLLKALSYVPQETFSTVKTYVNDAISFRMDPEVVLLYSDRFFGTADAVSVVDGLIRIHDLKTGTTPAHIEQLMTYDAYCCLEYNIDPLRTSHELRIYQCDDILIANPEGADIKAIMDTVKIFDKIQLEFEEG